MRSHADTFREWAEVGLWSLGSHDLQEANHGAGILTYMTGLFCFCFFFFFM